MLSQGLTHMLIF